ncbi:MAG: TonB-dependent siderophore receptor [Burkholderiales bacterium]
MSTDLALFERIEVVKGPSSTLYGLGTLSGFINRVSKKPRRERAASLVTQLGSFDTYRAEADATGPLDADKQYAARLVAVYEDSGAFIDGVDNRVALVAPSFDALLGAHTRLLLQAHHQDQSGTPSVGIPAFVGADGELRAPNVSRSFLFGNTKGARTESTQTQGSARLEHEVSDRWLASLHLQKSWVDTDLRRGVYGSGLDGRSRTGTLLDPETGEGYELGLKGEWFEQRLGATLSVFRQERDKVPLADRLPGDPPGSGFSKSAGLQRADGVELEMAGQPMAGLTLALAASWIDSKFDERSDPNFGQVTPDTVEQQISVYGNYEIAAGPLRGLGFGATVVAVGDHYGGIQGDNTTFAKPYERVDLNFSYTAIPGWDLSLQVRNVFDARYLETVSDPGSGNFFGSPTAVLFRAEYNFDL